MRLTFLDGLRCLAVMAVVAQHFLESAFPTAAKPFLSLGPGVFGVALFFMISGYVIPFSLRHSVDGRQFFLRRAFRIVPMYWATLCFACVLGAAGVPPYAEVLRSLDLAAGLSNAVLAFEFFGDPALLAVAWSLSLEIIWYFAIFVLFRLGGNDQCVSANFAVALVLLASCLISVVVDQRMPFGRMLMLNSALLGYARQSYDVGIIDRSSFIKINAGFLVSSACALFIGFDYFEHPNVNFLSNSTAWTASYLTFTTSCSFKLMRNSRFLNDPIIVALGTWSFSIYLLHEPIKNALATMHSGWSLIGSACVFTVGVSAFCYHAIERNGVRLGRALSQTRVFRRHKRAKSTPLNARKF